MLTYSCTFLNYNFCTSCTQLLFLCFCLQSVQSRSSWCRQTDKQGRVWCCCLVLRPGLETADWCKIETRGWNGWMEGESEREGERFKEWVKAEARLMAGERGEVVHKREGWEEGGRDIIEPVWVSRLTELQGAAPAHHCYCKFFQLLWDSSWSACHPPWYNFTHTGASLFLLRCKIVSHMISKSVSIKSVSFSLLLMMNTVI